jgi:hypothetical protein
MGIHRHVDILPDSDMCVKVKLNLPASPPGRLEFVDDGGRITVDPEVIICPAALVPTNAHLVIRSWIVGNPEVNL